MAGHERKPSSSSSSSNDYSKYGITDEPKRTTRTALGKTKTFARLPQREWLFLAVSFVNILTALGLTVYSLVHVVEKESESSDFSFILLLFINSAFSIFYVVHGVLRERKYELYAFMAAILVVATYCLLEYFAFNTSGQTTVKLVRVIVVIVMAPPNIVLAYLVSRGFGYLEFRIVGANEYLQRLYREAAIFSCLLKFHLQTALVLIVTFGFIKDKSFIPLPLMTFSSVLQIVYLCSVVILVLEDGTDASLVEMVTLGIGIPFSLLWCVFGWVTLKRELKNCAIVFAVVGLVSPAYYLFKVIKKYIAVQEDEDDDDAVDDTIVYSLIAAVTLGLLVWLMLMIELVFVYRNFGKGLRDRINSLHGKPVATEKTCLLSSPADSPQNVPSA